MYIIRMRKKVLHGIINCSHIVFIKRKDIVEMCFQTIGRDAFELDCRKERGKWEANKVLFI